MLAEDKKYTITCPNCKETREVCYSYNRNIKQGKHSGICRVCSHKERFKDVRLEMEGKNIITCPVCKKDREICYTYYKHIEKNNKKGICRRCSSRKQIMDGKSKIIGAKGKNHHMFGKKTSKTTKDKIAKTLSPKRIGDKNPAWKGSKTSINKTLRNLLEYHSWRFNIYRRDKFTCHVCYKIGGVLNAHHIKSLKKIIKEYNIINIKKAKECKHLWDENNGITVCRECHLELHKKRMVIKK